MKSSQEDRNRLWLTIFFAGIIALIALAALWWFTPTTRTSTVLPMSAPPAAVSALAVPGIDPIALKLLREDLVRAGVAQKVHEAAIDRALANFAPDTEIAAQIANQPEFVKTAGEYVDAVVSETRLANGRVKLAEYDAQLRAIETRYGVDRHILVAIWGIESAYGTSMGEKPVIRSLATLALTDPRRPAFWRGELIGALAMIERGEIAADRMAGSWAGAMGHTQFMPSTYNAHAVDFDGDGRRDIWGTPADALASAANYLKNSGWISGQPPIAEVNLPVGFDLGLSAPTVSKPLAQWIALGITLARTGARNEATANQSLILPAGANGPALLVGQNFRAILRYNNATSYALAVSHLADRLAGAPPLAKPWPTDDRPLARADREELQARLQGLGYDVGQGIDGVVGTTTRSAIRAFQRARAMPEDGHPNLSLLNALRKATENRSPAP